MDDASSHVKSAPATTRPAAQITEKATDRSSSFDRPTKASSDTAVCGWTGCKFTRRAVDMANTLSVLYPTQYEATPHLTETRDQYRELLPQYRSAVPDDEAAQKHTSAPFVYSEEGGATTFVGGCDAAVDWARAAPLAAPPASSMVDDGFTKEHGFDYDVVVVGGGSGGLACSKECAKLGAKVAVLDFVKPSPAGSTWGLGGTCVNVGCIPKKLMHTASIIGETLKDDAAAFGWKDAAAGAHDWESMKSTVQDHIKSLNFKYRVALREAGITYLNRLGEFEDKNTISLTDKKGNKTSVTAARDDLFSLPKAPGRVLCVGGGYIAPSAAASRPAWATRTACMVRSILLRGFDRECVGKIEAHIKHHGVQLQVGVTPAKIEKDAATGVLTVTDSAAASTSTTRCPAPRAYAIGDVVEGRPELTPVAIEAGLRLARRLFGGKTEPMDYENVATTIFTPLEYGTIGLSEDDAKAQLGECNVESYISEFAPLEYALSEARSERGDGCFAKLVVDKSTGKVVGFHYLGPNAGEITQGFSIAMRKGATYADFISTVGIHPTVAEDSRP
ncbi:thioredoxin-disulfide reductase [Aureococcus anophagefferens]|nr:thioredoxin-disulfide reductase [Aureococcus anophagefferens]